MILVTSLFTGLVAAMMRSLFAVMAIAFLVSLTFAIAFIFNGASLFGLVLAIAGFNGGLILSAAVYFIHTGARST